MTKSWAEQSAERWANTVADAVADGPFGDACRDAILSAIREALDKAAELCDNSGKSARENEAFCALTPDAPTAIAAMCIRQLK